MAREESKRGGISVPGSGCGEFGGAWPVSLQSLCFQGCFAGQGAGGSHRRSKEPLGPFHLDLSDFPGRKGVGWVRGGVGGR